MIHCLADYCYNNNNDYNNNNNNNNNNNLPPKGKKTYKTLDGWPPKTVQK